MKWMGDAVFYEDEPIWKPLNAGFDYKDERSLDAEQTRKFVEVRPYHSSATSAECEKSCKRDRAARSTIRPISVNRI